MIRDNMIIKDAKPFMVMDGDDSLMAGYKALGMNYSKFYKMDRLSKLATVATEVLLGENSLSENYANDKISVILSNANASLDADERYWQSVEKIASPALFVYTLPNIMTGEICIRYGFKGENAHFVFEQPNHDFLHEYLAMLLNSDTVDAAICGWIDVCQDHHEAFIYVIETRQGIDQYPTYTKENIQHLYELSYGKINGRSEATDH